MKIKLQCSICKDRPTIRGLLLESDKPYQDCPCTGCLGILEKTPFIEFNEYQEAAFETATYPFVGNNIVYPAMGLAGEAGEVCDKIKKHWRNYNVAVQSLEYCLTEDQIDEIILELGDVLWYIAAICTELGLNLGDVSEKNLEKLQDRRDRNVIKGEGDNR